MRTRERGSGGTRGSGEQRGRNTMSDAYYIERRRKRERENRRRTEEESNKMPFKSRIYSPSANYSVAYILYM